MTGQQAASNVSARGWRWPRSARHARVHALLAAAVMWVTAVVTLGSGSGDRTVAGPIKGSDFLQFYTIGHLARTHQTSALYDFAALHAAQAALVPESAPELYPPVYPPHVPLLFAPFSLLSYRVALLLWLSVTVVGLALVLRSVWRPVAAQLPDRLFVAAAAAAFPPLWSIATYGQVTLLVVGAFWAGWLALERRRTFLAGAAFGLLLVKPQFAIPLAVVVLACREWRMLAGAVASVALQSAVAGLVLGWSVFPAYGRFVPVMLQYADLLEPKPFNSHSLRALTRLAPDWIGLPLWGVLAVAVLFVTVKAWKSAAPLRVRLGIVMLASVLINPHLIVYDAAVLAPALIWLGADVQERAVPGEAAVFWMTVYWLFVSLLAPTAAVVGVQASVLLMSWLLVLTARRSLGPVHAGSAVASPLHRAIRLTVGRESVRMVPDGAQR